MASSDFYLNAITYFAFNIFPEKRGARGVLQGHHHDALHLQFAGDLFN